MKLNVFNQPFPLNTWWWYRQRAIGFGLFVFLFLLLFQPFSLHLYGYNQLFQTALLYGGITALVILAGGYFFVRIITPRISEESWTLGKQIGFNIMLMGGITFFNILVTQIVHQITLPFWWYFSMMKWVLMLGIIPIIVSELISYNRYLHQHLNSAKELSDIGSGAKIEQLNEPTQFVSDVSMVVDKELITPEYKKLTLTGENNGDKLILSEEKLLAVQALDNYVNIYWQEGEILQTTLIRNTLTNLADQLKDIPQMYKTHRGWLVNTNRVYKIEGNAQSLKLKVDLLIQPVPVSRSNISGYRKLLEQRQSKNTLILNHN